MTGPHVALGDRDVAGHPALRRQQVVAAPVETLLVDLVADRQQTATLVEQEREVHAEDSRRILSLEHVSRSLRSRRPPSQVIAASRCSASTLRSVWAIQMPTSEADGPRRSDSRGPFPPPRVRWRVAPSSPRSTRADSRRRQVVEQSVDVRSRSGRGSRLVPADCVEQRQPVGDPAAPVAVGARAVDPLPAALASDEEVARQVAVVHASRCTAV